jgi:hypothetical protein
MLKKAEIAIPGDAVTSWLKVAEMAFTKIVFLAVRFFPQ